jgi:hypothetical protein
MANRSEVKPSFNPFFAHLYVFVSHPHVMPTFVPSSRASLPSHLLPMFFATSSGAIHKWMTTPCNLFLTSYSVMLRYGIRILAHPVSKLHKGRGMSRTLLHHQMMIRMQALEAGRWGQHAARKGQPESRSESPQHRSKILDILTPHPLGEVQPHSINRLPVPGVPVEHSASVSGHPPNKGGRPSFSSQDPL